jgi:hypothetical protein
LMSFALKCFFKRNFATEFKENLSSHWWASLENVFLKENLPLDWCSTLKKISSVCLLESSFLLESEFQKSELFSDVW